MLKNKVQIYPPKASLTTQVNIFPITNILKGSGTIYGQSKFFSFIHQAAFDTLSQTCAFWYSPVGGIILRNIKNASKKYYLIGQKQISVVIL